VVDGIPILFRDPELRTQVLHQTEADPRTAFYQTEDQYLREDVPGEEAIKYGIEKSAAPGLVLEIGTGSGAFAGIGDEDYCGLDFSLTHLRSNLKGYRRICATAELIPLASSSCRVVFSVATLEHVPRPDLAFAEIDRVLKPGGVAVLLPAWHCRWWAADGLPVRSYRELSWRMKIQKAVIPVCDSKIFRALGSIPWRAWRRGEFVLANRPTTLWWKPLRANYEKFWMSDSDACAYIDSHEAILYFESRGYEIVAPARDGFKRIFHRAGAVTVQKPARSERNANATN